jgi:VWFA-related protein
MFQGLIGLIDKGLSMIRLGRLVFAFLAGSSSLFGLQDAARLQGQMPSAKSHSEEDGTPRPEERIKLTVRSDLVLIPVVVTDKSGKSLSGLQKDAFGIEENSKPRTISIFEEIKTERLAARPKDAGLKGYSNFFPGNDHPWRITIVVLDMINTPWMRQVEARKQLADYLLRTAQQDEPMALFSLNSIGLRQLHPLTTDTGILIAALQKLKLALSSAERTEAPVDRTDFSSAQQQASDEEQRMADALNDLDASVSANYQRIASRQTLAGLTQLARAFQAIPGRKTLIWATAGFPFTIDDPQSFVGQGDDLRSAYDEAWRALNSANIAVYPVDLNDLDVDPASLPSANSGMSSRIADIRGINGLKSPLRLPNDKAQQQRITLHAFAEATGGRACVTVAELEKCFAKAVDDSRDYYLLGYYLGDDTGPGWRKLKVKVAQDGVRVRSRAEFYLASKIEDTPELRRKEIVDALASPIAYTGIHLNAHLLPPWADPPSAAGPQKSAQIMLAIRGESITVDRENGNAINLEVTTLAFDCNRKSVATMSQSIATRLNHARLQKMLETGLGIPEKIELPKGHYEVKFAVRDNLSGMLGTISVPLELK